jgi:hypothetical protein
VDASEDQTLRVDASGDALSADFEHRLDFAMVALDDGEELAVWASGASEARTRRA